MSLPTSLTPEFQIIAMIAAFLLFVGAFIAIFLSVIGGCLLARLFYVAIRWTGHQIVALYSPGRLAHSHIPVVQHSMGQSEHSAIYLWWGRMGRHGHHTQERLP
jgi:hypothetical protein